jgi:predicted RNA-binding protein with PUA-like domain
MAPGDPLLIYHSGIGKELVGMAQVTSAPYQDPKQKDPKLFVVDIEAERRLPKTVPLAAIKADPFFADLGLVRMGRLSVMPVSEPQWKKLLAMGGLS